MQLAGFIGSIKNALRRQELEVLGASGFVLSAGALLLFVGASTVLGMLGTSQVLSQRDLILGLPIRGLILFVTTVSLTLAGLCLFGSKRRLTIGLLAWLAVTFIVYRIGLWTLGGRHSVGFQVQPLDFSFGTVDILLSCTAVYLLLGCLVIVGARLRRATIDSRQREARSFPTMSCPACGGHIQFAVENVGCETWCPHCSTRLTLYRPKDRLKMSCYFCNGHIEFPPHALGERLKCPHCGMDITLKGANPV